VVAVSLLLLDTFVYGTYSFRRLFLFQRFDFHLASRFVVL
jgi:hypothetical protein